MYFDFTHHLSLPTLLLPSLPLLLPTIPAVSAVPAFSVLAVAADAGFFSSHALSRTIKIILHNNP